MKCNTARSLRKVSGCFGLWGELRGFGGGFWVVGEGMFVL